MFSFSLLTSESWSQGFQQISTDLRFHDLMILMSEVTFEALTLWKSLLAAPTCFLLILCISTYLHWSWSCKLYMFERFLLRAKRIPFTQRPARPYLYMILCSSSRTSRHREIHTLQPGFPASLGGRLLENWVYMRNDQAIATCQKYPSNHPISSNFPRDWPRIEFQEGLHLSKKLSS